MKHLLLLLLLIAAPAVAHHHDHFVTIQPGITSDREGRFQEIDNYDVWFRRDHSESDGNDRIYASQFEEHYWWWRVEHGNDVYFDAAYCTDYKEEHLLVLTCDGHEGRGAP